MVLIIFSYYNILMVTQDYRLEELKDYFDHILDNVNPNITLDDEQRTAILGDDDAALIIAGAGTGKTTTMIAKVKYLVDIKKVDPKKILVMSYARKNVEELSDRINIDLGIPADVCTFHQLGYRYMKNLYAVKAKRSCYVAEGNDREQIFAKWLREKVFISNESIKDFVAAFEPKSVGELWLFGKRFRENIDLFNNFDEYFDFYKKEKLAEWGDIHKVLVDTAEERANEDSPRTLRGEHVRSKGEVAIANFLFENGIEYEYERVYEEIMPDYNSYRPDFTLNLGGEKVYVEYFGLSAEGVMSNRKYDKIRKIKEDYHRKHKTRFIALDYLPGNEFLDALEERLKKYGFTFRRRSDEEIANLVLDQNPLAEFFKVKKLFLQTVDNIKSSPDRDDYWKIVKDYLNNGDNFGAGLSKNMALKQYAYVNDFLSFYTKALFGDPNKVGFDYSDMIFFAKKYIEELSSEDFNYEYVIIDEYQDISFSRYELTIKTLERNHAKLTAVGDDWQSIYAFSGSKIEYTYNFKKLFPNAKLYRIQHTYRTVQRLADVTGEFIMKNKKQIRKHLLSDRNINSPIRFLGYEGATRLENRHNEAEVLKDAILKVHKFNPEASIMVLARQNSNIDDLFSFDDLGYIDGLNTKVSFRDNPDFSFDAMTIHKSKGLTADYVFVIGLNKSFPKDKDKDFWLRQLFMHKPAPEGIEFSEERRVFYVALTRTKNQVFLLRDKNPEGRSPFLDEIVRVIKEYEQKTFV